MIELIEPALDKYTGSKCIEIIIGHQFKLVEEIAYGTKETVQQGSARSSLSVNGYPEQKNKEAFMLPKKGTPPLKIDVWRFKFAFNAQWPDNNF